MVAGLEAASMLLEALPRGGPSCSVGRGLFWKKPAMLCCFLPVLAAEPEGAARGVDATLPLFPRAMA